MKNRHPLFPSIVPLELTFWIGGLAVLFFLDPIGSPPFDLCLHKFIGLDFCPGCGLGRSVSFLLHGDPVQSLSTHLLGPFALIVIVYRIIVLTKNSLTIHRKEHSHA